MTQMLTNVNTNTNTNVNKNTNTNISPGGFGERPHFVQFFLATFLVCTIYNSLPTENLTLRFYYEIRQTPSIKASPFVIFLSLTKFIFFLNDEGFPQGFLLPHKNLFSWKIVKICPQQKVTCVFVSLHGNLFALNTQLNPETMDTLAFLTNT